MRHDFVVKAQKASKENSTKRGRKKIEETALRQGEIRTIEGQKRDLFPHLAWLSVRDRKVIRA